MSGEGEKPEGVGEEGFVDAAAAVEVVPQAGLIEPEEVFEDAAVEPPQVQEVAAVEPEPEADAREPSEVYEDASAEPQAQEGDALEPEEAEAAAVEPEMQEVPPGQEAEVEAVAEAASEPEPVEGVAPGGGGVVEEAAAAEEGEAAAAYAPPTALPVVKAHVGGKKKIVYYVTTTASTLKLKSDIERTRSFLQAHCVAFEEVDLSLEPARREDMFAASASRLLPQLHVDGKWLGDFDTLSQLQDDGELGALLK